MKRLFIIISMFALVTGCSTLKDSTVSAGIHNKNQHKVVVIVVDSLTNHAIQTAMNDDKFPGIHYLMAHGHYSSHVVASFPSMTVSDLSTVITGTYPEQHHIPGLVWFDDDQNRIVNYGNNFPQTMALGAKPVSENALFHLNQTHLSKSVNTIFEDLQDAGYSTGSINMLVYRGRTLHRLTLPIYTHPFAGTSGYQVFGPDILVFGQFTSQPSAKGKSGVFNRFGLNDDFATDALVRLIKKQQLPDFTMVYLGSNDSVIHKHGVDAMAGVAEVDKNLQKVLSSSGRWDETLKRMTLVVMGDGGVTPVLPSEHNPTVLLKDAFAGRAVYRWGKKVNADDDLALAVNSRMAYVYLLNGRMRSNDAVKLLKQEHRINLIVWTEGNQVSVTTPENMGLPLSFHKGGPYTDSFGQTWAMTGNLSILDVRIGPHRGITYGKYPDALHQLWSAAHSQKGTYLIVTAKKGYQFGDARAPKHNGGAQQASLLAEDIYAPMIVDGAKLSPKEPSRFVDLKAYFASLVTNLSSEEPLKSVQS